MAKPPIPVSNFSCDAKCAFVFALIFGFKRSASGARQFLALLTKEVLYRLSYMGKMDTFVRSPNLNRFGVFNEKTPRRQPFPPRRFKKFHQDRDGVPQLSAAALPVVKQLVLQKINGGWDIWRESQVAVVRGPLAGPGSMTGGRALAFSQMS